MHLFYTLRFFFHNLTLLFDNLKVENNELKQNSFFTIERIKIACWILTLFVIILFGVSIYMVVALNKRFVIYFALKVYF